MMGRQQQREGKLFYTSFCLDERIRPDNPLRKIREVVDLSFVRPAVADRYGRRGNPSIDPIVLLKLMLILFLENIPSERELMRRLPERLDWLWFCQYDLDSDLPNHSVLSKARRRWGVDLFRTFFQNILSQCVEADLVAGEIVHIDSSLIQANASVGSLQPAFAVLAEQTYETLEENCELPPTQLKAGTKLSPTDPQARCRIKGSQKVLGYQEHRCVDDAHGIITATKTTHAAVHEGETLPEMIEQHQTNTDSTPSTVVADKAYGRADNYKMLQQQNLTPCIAHSKPAAKHKGQFTRDDFTYDRQQDCYVCPGGYKLTRQTQKPTERNEHMYKIGRHVCQQCLLRAKCYTGKYSKRIYRHADQEVIDWADTCLSRSRRRHLMGRRRCVSEGSFADSTNNHGYKRARWRSRVRVEMQNLLITSVQNLRKLISALSRGKRKSTTMAAELSAQLSIMLTQRPFRALCQPIWLIRSPYKHEKGQKLPPTESLSLNLN